MRLALAAFVAFAITLPAAAVDDPFAGNARGTLHVSIELVGSARYDYPNGVEWGEIDAFRTLDVDFAMVDVGDDGIAIVSSAPRGEQVTTPAITDLQSQLAACGDNGKCIGRVMTEFTQAAESSEDAFALMTGSQPGRYRNFVADRFGTCITGTFEVNDMMRGVYIPMPDPAIAYSFARTGSLKLPAGDEAFLNYACAVEITLDRTTGAMSLRLPAAKLDVPVVLGPEAYRHETSVPLIEGLQTIELIDQPAGPGGAWTGAALVAAGSATHTSTNAVAPLHARITWSFSEN